MLNLLRVIGAVFGASWAARHYAKNEVFHFSVTVTKSAVFCGFGHIY